MTAQLKSPVNTTVQTIVRQARKTLSVYGLVAAALIAVVAIGGHTAARSAVASYAAAATVADRGHPNTASAGLEDGRGIPQPAR